MSTVNGRDRESDPYAPTEASGAGGDDACRGEGGEDGRGHRKVRDLVGEVMCYRAFCDTFGDDPDFLAAFGTKRPIPRVRPGPQRQPPMTTTNDNYPFARSPRVAVSITARSRTQDVADQLAWERPAELARALDHRSEQRTMPIRLSVVFLALLSLFVVACAAKGRSALDVVTAFPTEEELEVLMSTPTELGPEPRATRHVERWVLQRPAVALGVLDYEPTTPAEKRLAKVASRRDHVFATSGMHCIAQEYGLFWREHGAYPSNALQNFIASRCGAATGRPRVEILEGMAPEAAIDALAKDKGRLLSHEVGVWSDLSDTGETLTVIATGMRIVDVNPVALDEGLHGAIVVQGRYLLPESMGQAYITRAGLGYQECTPDPRVEAPYFSMVCPVDPLDPEPTIELFSSLADSGLAVQALVVTFAPGSSLSAEFTAPRLSRASEPMANSTSEALVKAINQSRRSLGLPPLRREVQQSAVTGRLLPKYYDALRKGDLKVVETIFQGLMAGWGIKAETPIRDGDLYSFVISGEESVEAAVESALVLPRARATLLDPSAASVALSTQPSQDGKSFPTLITTYTFFDSVNFEDASTKVLDGLDRKRGAAGLPPVRRVQGGHSEEPMRRIRQRLREGKDPERTFRWALEKLVYEAKVDMAGNIKLYQNLDDVDYPEALLNNVMIQVDLDIDYYQPSDSPWGFYVVIIFYAP